MTCKTWGNANHAVLIGVDPDDDDDDDDDEGTIPVPAAAGTDAKQGYSLGGVEMQAEHFARILFREGQNELQACYLVCKAMPCHSTTLDPRVWHSVGMYDIETWSR